MLPVAALPVAACRAVLHCFALWLSSLSPSLFGPDRCVWEQERKRRREVLKMTLSRMVLGGTKNNLRWCVRGPSLPSPVFGSSLCLQGADFAADLLLRTGAHSARGAASRTLSATKRRLRRSVCLVWHTLLAVSLTAGCVIGS